MGTRSLTAFYDEQGVSLAVLYRQFDGYPAGHGDELRTILAGSRMVNGITLGETSPIFNGAGDLAVRTITALKAESGGASEPGGFYLRPPAEIANSDGWEEYRYHIRPGSAGEGIRLQVQSGWKADWTTLYDGPVDDFSPANAEPDEDDDDA